MHEMSLAYNLLEQVLELTRRYRASGVESVTLQVGELSGVVPRFLEDCFRELSRGTLAEGARLYQEKVPAQRVCAPCGSKYPWTPGVDNSVYCDACGKILEWQGGNELILKHLEVELDESSSASPEAFAGKKR